MEGEEGEKEEGEKEEGEKGGGEVGRERMEGRRERREGGGREEKQERNRGVGERDFLEPLITSHSPPTPPNAHTLSYEGIVKLCSISSEASYSSETDPRS